VKRRDLPIFPIAMRVDPFEKDRLNQRREYARRVFGSFVEDLGRAVNPSLLEDYWSLEIQYFASYAYEEVLSSFDKFAQSTGSLLPSVQRLTRLITNGDVGDRVGPVAENVRAEVLAEYADLPVLQTSYPLAPPPSRTVRATLWAVSAGWVLLLAALVFVTWRAIATSAHDRVKSALLVSYSQRHEHDDTQEAVVALAAADNLPAPEGARELGIRLYSTVFTSVSMSGQYESAALSPDNRRYVVTNGSEVTEFPVDGDSGIPFSSRAKVTRVEYSSDGEKILALGSETECRTSRNLQTLWALSFVAIIPLQSAFTPDSRLWNVVLQDGRRVRVAEYTTGAAPTFNGEFPSPKQPAGIQMADKVLSSDGTRVAVTDGRSISVWRLPSGDQAVPLRDLPADDPVIRYAFDGALTTMLLASVNSLRVVDLESFRQNVSISLKQVPSLLALSAKAAAVALAFPDGSANLYNGPQLGNVRQLRVKGDPPLKSLAFGADGKFAYGLCCAGNPSSGKAGDQQTGPGFYLWRVQWSDLPDAPTWPELTRYFKAVAGNCLSPLARQEVFFESAKDAKQNNERCRQM
jgi:hypothetical protein